MKKQYDNGKTTDIVDDTTIEGHEDVEVHFERERELFEAHGSSLTFQVYRLDLLADTLEALQGPRLAEFTVEGGAIAGGDTVAIVKDRMRSSLRGILDAGERITLHFNGRRMRDDALFFADHFVLLPAWVQVLLHEGESDRVEARIGELAGRTRRQG